MKYPCSINNQNVGVNLRSFVVIKMNAFGYCTSSELLSVLLIDGIGLSCVKTMLSALFERCLLKTGQQFSHVISWNVDQHLQVFPTDDGTRGFSQHSRLESTRTQEKCQEIQNCVIGNIYSLFYF